MQIIPSSYIHILSVQVCPHLALNILKEEERECTRQLPGLQGFLPAQLDLFLKF